MSTYVIPDLHGCLVTLKHLLEEKLAVSKSDKLYFLGDYIDRGPLSAQLVDYLLNLKDKGYSISTLKGNHEQMLLDSLSSKIDYKNWILNTGYLTLKSYKGILGEVFEFPDDLPDRHMLFYKNLPYYFEVDNYLLVHGGINYQAKEPLLDTKAMLWNRPESVPHDFLPGKTIIHGHTPTPLAEILEVVNNPINRLIPLDAGCVYAGSFDGIGYLVALELEKMELHWVEKMD
ncbi:MAG: metallophosphoesterase family protein [Bacteroidales bacterium]